MSKGLLNSVKHKYKLFAKCKGKAKDHSLYINYLKYKSFFNKAKSKAKLLYVNNILKGCQNSTKKTWEFVKNEIGKTHNKKSSTELLTVGERDRTNPEEIAEAHCRYFADFTSN